MRICASVTVYRDMSRLLRTFVLVVLCLLSASAAWAQATTLVVHRNANLREEASTQSDVLDHLEPGDELALLSPTKTAGFYHARTDAGIEGWVYQTLVHVDDEDLVAPAFAVTGVATAFDETWAKPAPVGSALTGPPGFDPCPANGEDGGDFATNRRKNRKDVPTSYHAVSFDAILALPDPAAPPNRRTWTQAQKDVIEPYEGVPVSVIGYINRVKKQHGGSGESTNCHFSQQAFVDVHVALVEDVGDGENQAIVVEPTPRFYAAHPSWVWNKLLALEHSPDPVRISGWTLFDPNHKNHMGKYRQTLWEIHPITKIEVFKNGSWVAW